MTTAKKLVNDASAGFRKKYGFRRSKSSEYVARVGACTHWLQNNASNDDNSIGVSLETQVGAVEEIFSRHSEWPFHGERWHVTLFVWYPTIIMPHVEGHPADYTHAKYFPNFWPFMLSALEDVVQSCITLRGALELTMTKRYAISQGPVADRRAEIARQLLDELPDVVLDEFSNLVSKYESTNPH